MEPTLPNGTAIRIVPSESTEYRIGQIVVCSNGHKLIAHRVVWCGNSGRTQNLVLTQGDGCLLCDPPVQKDAIQALVTTVCIKNRWQEPAATYTRRSWRRVVAAISVYLIRASLAVGDGLARFVARTFIAFALIFKRLVN